MITSLDLRELPSRTGVPCHGSSVRGNNNDSGLHGGLPERSLFWAENTKTAKLWFVSANVDHPDDYWKLILWIVESKIELFGRNENWFLWYKPNRDFEEQNLAPTMLQGSGSVMIWGHFAAWGTDTLAHIPRIMDFTIFQAKLQKANIEM